VTTFALMMMALVAVAVAALTTRLATAAKHTSHAREQAQVEELLLAGAELARQGGAGQAEQDVDLPTSLADAGVKLSVIVRDGRAQVQAAVGRTRQFDTVDAKPGPANPPPPPAPAPK
jgi:type II secretory pathway component PulK